MKNLTIGDHSSNPINSMRLQNQHAANRVNSLYPNFLGLSKSPSHLGFPKKVNPKDTMHPISTILKRPASPSLPTGEKRIVNNINSKSITEIVLETISKVVQIQHIGMPAPKKILQKTRLSNNYKLMNAIRLKTLNKFKSKLDLGRIPKWSTKKLG